MFCMSCSHIKVSLVRFPPVSTSSYTFLQCFTITCETNNSNHKLSTMKSFKVAKTCATNAALSPEHVPMAKISSCIDVFLLVITYF